MYYRYRIPNKIRDNDSSSRDKLPALIFFVGCVIYFARIIYYMMVLMRRTHKNDKT